METRNLNGWTLEVDSICRARLGSSWVDLCGEEAPLRDAFAADMSPEQFVNRWIEKYDLVSLDEMLHPFG